MGGHVFVSYSRTDQEYVEALAIACSERGIDCWIDTNLDYGSRWPQVIRERLDSCAAFVVVMTPEAEDSVWVGREIDQAESTARPIMPLLLRGDRFFRLAEHQFDDVRSGALPTERWFRSIRDLAGSQDELQRGTPPRDLSVDASASQAAVRTDEEASPARVWTRNEADREPHAGQRKDAREQQRKVLNELAHAEGIQLEMLKKPLELLTQNLQADEELLGACQLYHVGHGALAVTSRRLVVVEGRWIGYKVREIPYEQIVAAWAERGLVSCKLVISASPEGFKSNVLPEDRADALAALIDERAQAER
jgi:hypothetical protein